LRIQKIADTASSCIVNKYGVPRDACQLL